MRINVICAPQHTGSPKMRQAMKSLAKIGASYGGLTEMHRSRDRDIMRDEMGDKNRIVNRFLNDFHSLELPIFCKKTPWRRMKNKRRLIEQSTIQVSQKVKGKKGIGNPRFVHTAIFEERPGVTVAIVNTHWNAVIQNPDTGRALNHIRTVVTDNAARVYENELQRCINAGHHTFGMGDFNWRLRGHNGELAHWSNSPEAIAKRLKMDVIVDGLDRLMYSSNCVLVDKTIVKRLTKVNPMDHNWILGKFALV